MINVLYVHHVSLIGGGSYCLLNLLRALDRTIYHPTVLLKSEGPLVNELDKYKIEHIVMSELQTIPYNGTLFSYDNLHRYLIEVNKSCVAFDKLLKNRPDIDIVYLNNMMLFPHLKVAKRYGKKTIIHIREHWPLNEHILQLHVSQKYIENYADRIVAINEYSKSIVPQSSYKCTVVYDWIDLSDRYSSQPMSDIFNEDMGDKKVYVYTGGFSDIKGVKEVAETFSYHIKSSNSRLLMLGVNPKLKLAGKRNIIKKILYKFGFNYYFQQALDIINSDKRIKCIPSTYNIVDLINQSYCNISYFTIPHANLALAEWIITGKPSIAAKTEESVEYSCSLQDECLFKFNSMQDFINKVQWLDNLDNYSKVSNRISCGLNLVKNKFDPATNSKKLNEVYKKL